MNPEVARRWHAWSEQLEGRIRWMYLDIKGLVTTGVGNLIDPVEYALPLPWMVSATGQRATEAQIRAEWQHMKANPDLARRGARAAGEVATLSLTDAAVDALVLAKLEENDAVYARRILGWQAWPWQAQMVRHSIGWACGPHAGYPRFEAAVARGDWKTAITECLIPGEATNRGLIARNAAQRALLKELQNAAPAPAPGAPVPGPSPGTVAAPATAGAAPPAPRSGSWLEGIVALLRSMRSIFVRKA